MQLLGDMPRPVVPNRSSAEVSLEGAEVDSYQVSRPARADTFDKRFANLISS